MGRFSASYRSCTPSAPASHTNTARHSWQAAMALSVRASPAAAFDFSPILSCRMENVWSNAADRSIRIFSA